MDRATVDMGDDQVRAGRMMGDARQEPGLAGDDDGLVINEERWAGDDGDDDADEC